MIIQEDMVLLHLALSIMIDNRYGKNKYDTQFNEWTTCHPFIIDCYYSYHYNNTSRCKVVRVGFFLP